MSAANDTIKVTGRVALVFTNTETGEKRVVEAPNVVTDDGLTCYAATISPNDTPVNNFLGLSGRMQLAKTVTAPASTDDYSTPASKIAGSIKAFDAGYPKLNDTDVDNPGKGASVLTYKVSWATSDFNDTGITAILIHLSGASGSDPILMHSLVTSVDKSASETLAAYVNHSFA